MIGVVFAFLLGCVLGFSLGGLFEAGKK